MPDLTRYWPDLLEGHEEIRTRLIEAYDEPHRGYHDVRHLHEVLERIDTIHQHERRKDIDLTAVRLAAWFHDAVYDAEGDNEQRSAEVAERELRTAGLPRPMVDEVVRLVRATESHRVDDGDANGQVLCDADLGILAVDDHRYGEYVRGVRREYAHVSDEDFRAGRAQILRDLIAAPTLFRTRYAREHWETAARANVARELAQLQPETPANMPRGN
jgi:predicted metal-dependent HD superfamily phosphohydrolase